MCEKSIYINSADENNIKSQFSFASLLSVGFWTSVCRYIWDRLNQWFQPWLHDMKQKLGRNSIYLDYQPCAVNQHLLLQIAALIKRYEEEEERLKKEKQRNKWEIKMFTESKEINLLHTIDELNKAIISEDKVWPRILGRMHNHMRFHPANNKFRSFRHSVCMLRQCGFLHSSFAFSCSYVLPPAPLLP